MRDAHGFFSGDFSGLSQYILIKSFELFVNCQIWQIYVRFVNIFIVRNVVAARQCFYRPQTRLREGNVFYTCLSVILFTEWGVSNSGSGGCTSTGHTHPWTHRHPSPQLRSTSRRYTSYWNAFLLHLSVILSIGGQTPPGQTPPRADTPQGRHPARDGHCSGWYASYWNAFLLLMQNV